MHRPFIDRAIELSLEGVASGGGPFGAVVVKNGQIIGEGKNSVVPGQDPTAHAEINAIRQACRTLATHDLSSCVIYTSCEPCPMCLGAIWWARLKKIYYCNSRTDAAAIDFDDNDIYQEISRPVAQRKLPAEQLDSPEALEVFELWKNKVDKTPY